MATPAAGAGDVPQRRVQRSFKQVPDFDRDARGDVVWTSLKGPARLEASEQFAREQFVAIEEAKILREKVRRCRLQHLSSRRTQYMWLLPLHQALRLV